MRRFSIVNITNPIWTDLVAKSKQYDFCHTRSYHQLDKGGTPLLFVICDNDCRYQFEGLHFSLWLLWPVEQLRVQGLTEGDVCSIPVRASTVFQTRKHHYCVFPLAPDHYGGRSIYWLWYNKAC